MSERIDLQNYIDYFVFQTYIQNRDWLGIEWGLNNVKIWRPDTAGGRWRYMMYDTDFGFGIYGGNVYLNTLASARNPGFPNLHSQLFDHVLDNQEFKCQFANRYNDLMNTTFQPANFNATADVLQAELAPAIPDHIDRWGSLMGPFSYANWLNSIGGIKSYNQQRITTARQHLNQTLNLQGTRLVNMFSVPAQGGRIRLNSLLPELPWSGSYNGACPVHAAAVPNWGYLFSHWSSSNANYSGRTEDSLEVQLSSNTSLTAHFERCEDVVNVAIASVGNRLVPSMNLEIADLTYTWLYGDAVVSNDSVLYNPIQGDYRLLVRFDSCEVRSNVLRIERETYALHLFPNPTAGELTLQFVLGEPQDLTVGIYNTLGELMLRQDFKGYQGQFNSTFDVRALSAGLYFVRAETPDKAYSGKFIKED